jgi:3',5'-cyclic AMP phosphodiesterase CpdA
MLLAQLSDPHVNDEDPGAADALAAAVRAVLGLAPRPDAVLVSGDLAEHASAGEYARVRELLAPLPMPVLALAGNHDDPGAIESGDELRFAGHRLLLCATAQPGRDDGRLDVERLAARLDAEPDTPTIVAMHHPPIPVGIAAMDAIGLPQADRGALARLLERSPQVRRVVAGHVHRSATGVLGGCPVSTCGSTYRQARLDLAGDALELIPDEPPVYALHADVGGALVTHVVGLRS